MADARKACREAEAPLTKRWEASVAKLRAARDAKVAPVLAEVKTAYRDEAKAKRDLEAAAAAKAASGGLLAERMGWEHTPSLLEQACCPKHAFERAQPEEFLRRHRIQPPPRDA